MWGAWPRGSPVTVPPMPDLAFDHDHDALAWSERQASLLRRLVAGERVNEAIDWTNVIEEVQDVGASELRACKSLLRQAIIHLIKLHAWPGSRSAGHWRSETLGLLAEMRDAFSPSMRQRIDLAQIYALALRQAETAGDDSGVGRQVRHDCPYDLDDLLAADPAVVALSARLAPGD